MERNQDCLSGPQPCNAGVLAANLSHIRKPNDREVSTAKRGQTGDNMFFEVVCGKTRRTRRRFTVPVFRSSICLITTKPHRDIQSQKKGLGSFSYTATCFSGLEIEKKNFTTPGLAVIELRGPEVFQKHFLDPGQIMSTTHVGHLAKRVNIREVCVSKVAATLKVSVSSAADGHGNYNGSPQDRCGQV